MDHKGIKSKGFKFFVIIFIGIILLFSKRENQEKFINFIKDSKIGVKELELKDSIPIGINIDQAATYGDSIILWGENRLKKLKLDGKVEWEKEFNTDEPLAYFGKEEIFVYERPIGQVYILNPQGETIDNLKLNMEIYNIAESSGVILAHIKEEDNEKINILDKKGNLIEERSTENKNILTYCIDKNNKSYGLATLNLKGENLKTEIQIHGIEGEFLWTAYLDNEIAMYLNFDDKNNLIVLSDKGIYQINDGSILWKKQFQLIKDIYMDDENIHILYGNTLETISFDGRTLEKDSFTEEYRKILYFDRYIVLYGNNHIIGLKEGREVFKYKSEDPIIKVMKGVQKLIVVYEDKIDIIPL